MTVRVTSTLSVFKDLGDPWTWSTSGPKRVPADEGPSTAGVPVAENGVKRCDVEFLKPLTFQIVNSGSTAILEQRRSWP